MSSSKVQQTIVTHYRTVISTLTSFNLLETDGRHQMKLLYLKEQYHFYL